MDYAKDAKEIINNFPKTDPNTFLLNAVNLVFYLLGAIAVIMIIYSGFQLTTSAGNPAAIAKAKNTLIFSVVGLIIAIMAYLIVNFITESF